MKNSFLIHILIIIAIFFLGYAIFKEMFGTFTLSRNFSELYMHAKTVPIADFENYESWNGSYTLDDVRVTDGSTAMNLVSYANTTAMVQLKVAVPLNEIRTIRLAVFVSPDENIDNIKTFEMRIKEKDNEWSTSLPKLTKGWNILSLPLTQFRTKTNLNGKTIDTVSFLLLAKKDKKIGLTIDRAWAEGQVDYETQFKTEKTQTLGIRSINKKNYVQGWQMNDLPVLFQDVPDKQNYVYTAKLIPLAKGEIGIAYRMNKKTKEGYLFTIEGIRSQKWSIVHLTNINGTLQKKIVAEGKMNQTINKEEEFWMRIRTKGDTMEAYISRNNVDYVKIGEVKGEKPVSGITGFYAKSGSVLLEYITIDSL